MRYAFLSQLFLSLLIVSTLGLVSCVQQTRDTSSDQARASIAVPVANVGYDLPELLPRNPGVGSPAEQEKMQQIYTRLKREIAADPTDYRKRLQVAQVYMLEARATGEHGHYYPAALKVLHSLLGENVPKEVLFAANALKASVYLSLHRFEEALQLAQYAVSLNGRNALIYGSLVDAHVELGQYEEAVRMADTMTSIRPDLRSYSRISYLREIYGDMPGAIEAMKLAIQAGVPGYEDHAWCRLTLGHLYEATGHLDSAAIQYQYAVQERVDYPFAKAALASIYAKRKQYEQAENELQEAIALIPEVSFLEQLVDICQQTGRTAEAEKNLRVVLNMLADDEAKGHKMGMEYALVYLDLIGDYKEAFAYAEEEYEARPQNIEVNRLMSEILYRQGKAQEALPYLEVAMRTGSQAPRLLHTAGLVYAANGQARKGKKLVQQALSLDPHLSYALTDAGIQLLKG